MAAPMADPMIECPMCGASGAKITIHVRTDTHTTFQQLADGRLHRLKGKRRDTVVHYHGQCHACINEFYGSNATFARWIRVGEVANG